MKSSHRNFQAKILDERRSGRDRRGADDIISAGTERRSSKDSINGIERRKHRRFKVKDFTFVKFRSESDEDVGQLLDISKEGLSLRYFVNTKKPKNFYKLDIYLSGGDFIIAGIPFKTISNTELNDGLQFSPPIFRRSSVQFGHLTPNQISKLDYFLSQLKIKDPLEPFSPRGGLDESPESGLVSNGG